MRLRRLVLIALAALLYACQSSTGERVTFPDDAVSLEKLDGWTDGRERGSVVFSDPDSRATIAIRAATLPVSDPPTLAELLASTRTVLAGYRSSRVQEPEPIDHPSMTGAVFDLEFVPPGRAETYARRHAVLRGKRHFYHVMLTAPQVELASAIDPFSETVSSLREE